MKKQSRIFSFIGMSGVGKSFWAEKFRQNGYSVYPIDDLISEQIQNLISGVKADKSVKYEETKVGDLAKWMGFPGDKRYKNNSKKYLKLESKITLESIKRALTKNGNTIIDTTGSVIYTEPKVQQALKKYTKVVYFETNQENLDKMFKVFCAVPKPIIWGNIYKPLKNENESQTLKRCYKKLLDSRIKKYKKIADVKLNFDFTHKRNLSLNEFFNKIS